MKAFQELGKYTSLLYQSLRSSTEFGTYRKSFFHEMVKIGYDSVPIIMLTGFFTGSVMTIQSAYQLDSAFIPLSTIGAIVSESILIELAAVISSLVLAGKVGARIATELGTMRVTEQIDALESMGFNSVSFLVVPRVLAGILMFPVLYIVASVFGVGGGLLAGVFTNTVPATDYLQGARMYFSPWTLIFGFVKMFVFGFIITSISCYKGYFATGGAEGVGTSTTNATVLSCMVVLLADFLLAALLL
ncbi:ABC transporter permease [Rhodohalobacter sp. SW132]|uniref:MlaE family ABC transporter permease n=1 Tax=Rhodohalobacter sp. SW132 TaxID=2293433 RepID=UPI000E2599AE|nr:ABC transporter permease [Rhodohalobacter sp. SW132]REL39238.1 ABC transporter permease [Rhodohalobacter sp. SW132]